MSQREQALIDGMVKKILYKSIGQDLEMTPHALYLFGHNKHDYPVTEEEIKEALHRRLVKGLVGFLSDDEPLEEQEALIQEVHAIMTHYAIPIQPDLSRVAWQQCSYEALQAISERVYYYSGPDLLFEYQD